jgi:hypothetical protein
MAERDPESVGNNVSYTESFDCIVVVMEGLDDTTRRPARPFLLGDPPPPRRPPIPERPENGQNPPVG